MGGAPPPPQGFAPQGPKKPEKFAPLGAGFGRFGGGRGSALERGVGGLRTTTQGPNTADIPPPVPGPLSKGGTRGIGLGANQAPGAMSPPPADIRRRCWQPGPRRGWALIWHSGKSALIARRSRNGGSSQPPPSADCRASAGEGRRAIDLVSPVEGRSRCNGGTMAIHRWETSSVTPTKCVDARATSRRRRYAWEQAPMHCMRSMPMLGRSTDALGSTR